MRTLFLTFLLLLPSGLLAQLTQVSGTIKDPSGLPYSNGTISATLVISGTPRFSFNSLPYTPPSAPVGLDTTGSFVMSLGDVNQLTPSGGTWSFHVCSAVGTVQPGSPITSGPVCFDAPGFIITGAAVNISAQLSLAAPALTPPTVTGVTSINGSSGGFTFTGPGVSCTGLTCNFPQALSSLTAATATNTINNGTDLTQTWNWALSGAVPGFQIGESVANTNTTTPLLNVVTAPGSFTTPVQISQGVINSIVNVPALQINTSFNATGTVDDIFRVNATATLAGNTNTNFFNFLGGAAGTTTQARLSIVGVLYLNSPITTTGVTSNLTLCTTATAQCVANQPGVIGALFAQGGDNLNSGALARAGAGIFRGGMLTNATPNAAAMEGTTQMGAGFLGSSAAIFNTVCMTTTAYTVADCSATGPQANVIGVTTSTSNPIGVVIGGTVPMNLDNTGVIGDFVCRGTVAAGQNHDNGTTACGAGLGMGIVIAVSGQVASMAGASINSTVTLSTTTPLVLLRIR